MKKLIIAVAIIVLTWAGSETVEAKSMSSLTETQCQTYIQKCNFTPSEKAVFDCRIRDKSITSTAIETCMSEPTVNRKIASIKRKMALVDSE